jgi:hypothetical protein
MTGRRQVKGLLSLETIETWIEWARYLTVFEWGIVVGRCQVHRFECVKNCNAAGFPVYQE